MLWMRFHIRRLPDMSKVFLTFNLGFVHTLLKWNHQCHKSWYIRSLARSHTHTHTVYIYICMIEAFSEEHLQLANTGNHNHKHTHNRTRSLIIVAAATAAANKTTMQ